jgi:hypothetical protein
VSALALRELIPHSLLAGRYIAVLVCYLDDSGKDPQNSITTVAGYIARDTDWAAWELAVEPVFTRYDVKVLHAKELEDTKGNFKDWKVLKKQSFIAQVCMTRPGHVMMGMSASVLKTAYKQRADESTRKRTVAPYTFCFNVIIDWIMRDIRVGGPAHHEGVAFILEYGHENNPEAEQQFHAIRKLHNIENVLRSISFVPKDNCRAIQLADLLAFYSRRDGVEMMKARKAGKDAYRVEVMSKIIVEGLPHRSTVAADFDQGAEGVPYWRPPS